MKIVDIVCAPGRTGFFFDDQKAIKHGAVPDGFAYSGEPKLPGFSAVRQAGESIAVMLILENGQIAHGDCAAVQYSGVGGRDPLFLARDYLPVIRDLVMPKLKGIELNGFREIAEAMDSLTDPLTGKPLHTAIRYGVTQALLDAAAKATGQLMTDVVAQEYGTVPVERMIPIFTQSGDERYVNVDKMILKSAPVIPHGLINNVETKLGRNGGLLLDYVRWLRERVYALRAFPDYQPVLHIDVYGTIGSAFENDIPRMTDFFERLAKAAEPLKLRIEGPVDMGDQDAQIEMLVQLRDSLDKNAIPIEIVADEWCNTLADIRRFADEGAGHMLQIKTPDLGGINNSIEAVLCCRAKHIGAYLGGTCNETDRSAQVCVHVAMATDPDQILAKPGMGMDEGFMVVYNEMSRVLALRQALRGGERNG